VLSFVSLCASIDIGFPAQWALKDTLSLAFGLAGVLATGAALELQRRANKWQGVILLPDPLGGAGEDDTSRQYRLAETRAERRAIAERGRRYELIATVIFVLTTLCAFVASEPWLSSLALVALIGCIAYAGKQIFSEPKATATRLEICRLYREAHSLSLSTPYIFDKDIYVEIDNAFTTPEPDLPDLEQLLRLEIIKRRQQLEAYRASRRQP
jgi:hypothetical protein